MKIYTEKELSHWQSTEIFRLDIKKAEEFIIELVLNLPNNSLISFEGEMSAFRKPNLVTTIEKTQNIRRNTIAPILDFWIFRLNNETKNYLINDFVNSIGIRDNVIHISVEHDAKLTFNSNDNFHPEAVFISCGKLISYQRIKQLEKNGVIHIIEKLKIASNNHN